MTDNSRSVLIVTPDIHGPIRNGGIGTAFLALAERLTGFGYNVTVLYALGNHTESHPIEYWVQKYKEVNITLVPLENDIYPYHLDAPSYRALAWTVDRWLRINSHKYLLAIFPEWMGLSYYALLAKGQGLAYQHLHFIVNTHSPESWAREGGRNLPNHLDDIDRDFMEREAVARADIVVSPSQYLFNWMAKNKWTFPAEKKVIPNLLPSGSAIIPSLNKTQTKKITHLIFFGRLETRKGLRLFMDAIDRIKPDLKKTIKQITFLGKSVTQGTFSSVDFINSRSSNWDFKIKVVTDKNRDEALQFLAGEGKVCVIPSLVENSPYTVLECLENRIVFCASNVGGIPELIHEDDHFHTLFDPEPESLARIIENKLSAPCEPARAYYKQEEIAQKWRSLISSYAKQNNTDAFSTEPNRPNPDVESFRKPLVSICLTHYERPLLLARALESIRNQTYTTIEVVLVDDGSKSEAAKQYLEKLAPEFSTRDWQILRQNNKYLGAARNNAAAHARGEYILFMDDDNVAMPQELEVFVNAMHVSGADILTCAAAPFSGQHTPEKPKNVWLPLGGSAGAGLFSNAFGDANAFWRSSVFHALGGFTEDYGVGHEDWELFAHAVLSGYRLEIVPEALFWYRVNPQGMLRAGDPWADHARSARPYLYHNPGGLGSAIAYAAYLQQKSRLGENAKNNIPTLLKRFKVLARHTVDPLMWIKLRASYRQLGFRRTIGKIRVFVRDRARM